MSDYKIMTIRQLDLLLHRMKTELDLPTVRVIFDGSGTVEIFLSDSSTAENPWVRNFSLDELSSDSFQIKTQEKHNADTV